MAKGELLAFTHEDGEETIDNEAFFNDLVEGLSSATNQMREQNARAMLREMTEWVGREPKTREERETVSHLRERALAVIGH